MKIKFYFLVLLIIVACKKEEAIVPDAPLLIGPENNNSCTTAIVINEAESQVTFSWQTALNADEYELVVRDIETNTEYQQTTFNLISNLVLDSGKQYSWWVISKAIDYETFSKSNVWTFYLEGYQQQSHFPFPADLLSPQADEQISLADGKFVLRWESTDLDNDIIEYDIYLGTDPDELILQAEKLKLNSVELSLSSGQNYYWKVLTRDSEGNVSNSPVQMFRTLS